IAWPRLPRLEAEPPPVAEPASPCACALAAAGATGAWTVRVGCAGAEEEPPPLVLLWWPPSRRSHAAASTATAPRPVWYGSESCAIGGAFGISREKVECGHMPWTVRTATFMGRDERSRGRSGAAAARRPPTAGMDRGAPQRPSGDPRGAGPLSDAAGR